MRKKTRFSLLSALAPFLCSCAGGGSPLSESKVLFDTLVTGYSNSGDQTCLDEVFTELTEWDQWLDAYEAPPAGVTSIYSINHTNEPVTVSAPLAELLYFMNSLPSLTEGLFNPLIGNLTALWKEGLAAATPFVPDQTAIDSAVAEIADTEHNFLEINGTMVTRHGSATLDVGAIGKGWALREIRHVFEDYGEADYLLDGGSSSFLFGQYGKGDGTYSVTFSDIATKGLKLHDTALGVSSISEQKAVINGVTYSHLVNPLTGSAAAPAVMAGAIGIDAGLCDAMSTVFFLAGADKTKTLATQMGLGYVYFDGTNFQSGNGAPVYDR